MDNLFIPYTEALALHELGYDRSSFCEYAKNRKTGEVFLRDTYQELQPDGFNNSLFPAPLYQQAFEFFREEYGIVVSITPSNQYWNLTFYNTKPESFDLRNDLQEAIFAVDAYDFSSYKEAELGCIKVLIEFVSKNKIEIKK